MNVVSKITPRIQSIEESDPHFQIAAARRILYREGVDSQIGGHISLRVPGEDAFYVTPYQYFDETLPEHVMKVGFDLKVREPGTLPASPGINFHASVFMARPDVNCVIHTHGRQTCVYSSLGKPLEPYHTYASIFYQDNVFFADDPSMTPDVEGEMIARLMGDKRAVIMSHHGAIHAAASLEVATVDALLMEFCCGVANDVIKVGGKLLDEGTVRSYRRAYLKNTFHRIMWDSNYRRIRKSDPDLFALLG